MFGVEWFFHGALRGGWGHEGHSVSAQGACCGVAAVCLDVGGWYWGDLQEALGVSWAWEARGQATVTWGKDTGVIRGVGTICTVE